MAILSMLHWVGELKFPDYTPIKTSPVVDRCAELKFYDRPYEDGQTAMGVLMCTRPKDHSGRHASGDGKIVIAVWK